jgi:hypothetical protein
MKKNLKNNMRMLGASGVLDFFHRLVFYRTQRFIKLDLFPSSDEAVGDTYSVGSNMNS